MTDTLSEFQPAKTTNPAWDGVERRSGIDRRRFGITSLRGALLAPRRFTGRRHDDRRYALLDRYDGGVVTMTLLLVVFSILDSLFTLRLIAAGGEEINPVMNALLQHSVWLFTSAKMAMTAIPALLLLATANLMLFGVVRSRSLLGALCGLYLGLIVYEIGLLTLLP